MARLILLYPTFCLLSSKKKITLIRASTNIVACGLLKKEGYEVKFSEFMKIEIPFTIVAVGMAYLFILFIWSK